MDDNNLKDLSSEEREALLRVMHRAKEFDKANAAKVIYMALEGQLYKWTNHLKGWQPRWFYVDHDQGVLHYYTVSSAEERKKHPPRGSLHLWGAEVSPSEEDSQSFVIHGANNELYKLRAADAKERQFWVSQIRQEVAHANSLAIGPIEQGSATNGSKPSSSSSTPSHNSTGRPADHTSNHTRRSSRRQQLSAPLNLSITKLSPRRGSRTPNKASTVGETSFQQDVTSFPGGDGMLEVLTRLQGLNEQLNQQLELTCSDAGVSCHDKSVLLLKSTSQAGLQSIQDCLAMMNIEMGRQSRGTSPVPTTNHTPLVHSMNAQTNSQTLIGSPSEVAPSHSLTRSMSATAQLRRDMQSKRASAVM